MFSLRDRSEHHISLDSPALRGVSGMFDRRWVALALTLILLGAWLGTIALVVLSAFMLVIGPIARRWSQTSLRGVTWRRKLNRQRAFPGENLELTVEVENNKLMPIAWLKILDNFPAQLAPTEPDVIAPSHKAGYGTLVSVLRLRWYERVARRYTLVCRKRGIYALGPVSFYSGDIFSLYETSSRDDSRDWVLVYPQIVSLEDLGIPSQAPFGDIRSRRRLFEDPNRIMGARDYQPQDGFRHIHWKATARHNRLQTKVYEPTVDPKMMICLNIATFAQPWQGIRVELLEHAIIVAASLANYAVESKCSVGLLVNGAMPHADQSLKILPGRSVTQLAKILETLAAVSPFVTTSIEHLLLDHSPRLPWGATLVVVTSIITDELCETISQLQRAGRHMVLVAVGDEPPHISPKFWRELRSGSRPLVVHYVSPSRTGTVLEYQGDVMPSSLDFRRPPAKTDRLVERVAGENSH